MLCSTQVFPTVSSDLAEESVSHPTGHGGESSFSPQGCATLQMCTVSLIRPGAGEPGKVLRQLGVWRATPSGLGTLPNSSVLPGVNP